MNKKLKPLSMKEKEQIYGGWSCMASNLPTIISAVKNIAIGMIGYKMFSSNSGQWKGFGLDAKWDNKEKNQTDKVVEKHYFYGY